MRERRTIAYGPDRDTADLIIDYSDRDLGTMIAFPMGDKWVNVTAHCVAGWFTEGELWEIEQIIKEKLED